MLHGGEAGHVGQADPRSQLEYGRQADQEADLSTPSVKQVAGTPELAEPHASHPSAVTGHRRRGCLSDSATRSAVWQTVAGRARPASWLPEAMDRLPEDTGCSEADVRI